MVGDVKKNFVGKGEAQKKLGTTPHKDKKASPHLEKKVAKRNLHDEKVAIAPPPSTWAPAGGARVGGRPPPHWKIKTNVCWLIGRPFCYFFSMWSSFLLRLWGGGGLFSPCGGLFLTCPPPPTKISAGAQGPSP